MPYERAGTSPGEACDVGTATDLHRDRVLRLVRALWLPLGLLVLGSAGAAGPATPSSPAVGRADVTPASARPEARRMWMTVGEHRFAITPADNPAARAFAALLPMTIEMPDLNGNEKHAKLPRALPASAHRPGTIRIGDLMLYGSDTLVVFYLTFESPYSYTRLGRVDDPAGLARALGPRVARIVFSVD